MYFRTQLVYRDYIKGELVERSADLFLAKFNKINASRTAEMDKTQAKIALFWLGISLLISATVNAVSFSPLGALFIVGLVPFFGPLHRNVTKVVAETKKKFLPHERAVAKFSWTVSACTQVAATFGLSRVLSVTFCISASFILSNIFFGGALLATAALYRNASVPSQNDLCRQDCVLVRQQIADLKRKIRMIDALVAEKPDLREIVKEHLKKYGQFIATREHSVKIKVKGPEDWIGRYGALSLKKLHFEHWLNERIRFIRSHTPVFNCFKKHVLSLREKTNLLCAADKEPL